MLRNGGVAPSEATEVLTALLRGWPNVVLRARNPVDQVPTVPLVPLLPGELIRSDHRVAVYQRLGWRLPAPGPAIALPTPSRGTVRALCEGRLPMRSRWVAAWGPVWEMPWA